jgi:hypothetical protein
MPFFCPHIHSRPVSNHYSKFSVLKFSQPSVHQFSHRNCLPIRTSTLSFFIAWKYLHDLLVIVSLIFRAVVCVCMYIYISSSFNSLTFFWIHLAGWYLVITEITHVSINYVSAKYVVHVFPLSDFKTLSSECVGTYPTAVQPILVDVMTQNSWNQILKLIQSIYAIFWLVNDIKAIQKVTSSELLTKQATRTKNFYYTQKIHT